MATTVGKTIGAATSALAVLFMVGQAIAGSSGYSGPYNFGRPATPEEIAAWDIDVRPDGTGLPPGSGTYAEGKDVYIAKCASCHGEDLEGVKGTGGRTLKGGIGTLASGKPKKTVGSYWPYATILFDFTKRAMPFDTPGSLSDDEVYAVSAYILGENGIITKTQVLNAETLPKVLMPNRDGFISDPRPDVHNFN